MALSFLILITSQEGDLVWQHIWGGTSRLAHLRWYISSGTYRLAHLRRHTSSGTSQVGYQVDKSSSFQGFPSPAQGYLSIRPSVKASNHTLHLTTSVRTTLGPLTPCGLGTICITHYTRTIMHWNHLGLLPPYACTGTFRPFLLEPYVPYGEPLGFLEPYVSDNLASTLLYWNLYRPLIAGPLQHCTICKIICNYAITLH